MRPFTVLIFFIAPFFILPWKSDPRLDTSRESIRMLLTSDSRYATDSLRLALSSVDPNLIVDGWPLIFSIGLESCNGSQLEALLARHANPNATGPHGEHALIAAMNSFHGNCDGDKLALALIEHGANVNVREGDDTPLSLALGAPSPKYALAEALIRAGADPNQQIRTPYGTGVPLDIPLRFEDVDGARVLLKAGARLDAEPYLASAIAHGHLEFAQQLLDLGVQLSPSSASPIFYELLGPNANSNLSYYASYGRQLEAIRFLLKLKPPLDIFIHGEPLLNYARRNAPNAVKLLLNAGADPSRRDAGGLSSLWRVVLHRDAFNCRSDELKLLLEHGADANDTLTYSHVYSENEEALLRRPDSDGHDPSRKVSLLEAAITHQHYGDEACIALIAEHQAKIDKYTARLLEDFDRDLASKWSSKTYKY